MNKNPERPKNMNEVMSLVSNPNYKTKKEKEMEAYKRQQKALTKSIFGDY
jgi:hypothetical protein